jgi:acyl-CoA synthetase (AMP-forming)/AMP-acid ligase II
MIRRRESAPKIREQRFHFVTPLTVRLQLRALGQVELAAQSRFRERPTTAVRHRQQDRRRHSRPAFIEVRTTIVTALAGTHICLRRVEARAIYEAIAREGETYPVLEGLMVADPASLAPVPADGATMGEIFMRGNIVIKGYLKNPGATEEAFAGGWFHSGDLGVKHPDGYIELKDRSKDIIISGGENISTIEVEDVLYRHPAVLEAAVVARPDPMWGETPCAFVTLKPETEAAAEDIIAFCRTHLTHFKAPRTVIFCPLPKTSSGKIQKFMLRERAKDTL